MKFLLGTVQHGVAQVNDGYEPNTDEQNAALVPMIPHSDYGLRDNTC